MTKRKKLTPTQRRRQRAKRRILPLYTTTGIFIGYMVKTPWWGDPDAISGPFATLDDAYAEALMQTQMISDKRRKQGA